MVSLKKQLLSGITYTAISKYLGIVISLIITAILARLISPSEFGIVAIAMVLIVFFGLLSDFGIAPAIIQHKELSQEELSDIFSLTFWTGLVLAFVFFLICPLIANYYENQLLLPICQILSVNLLFSTWNITPNALIYKAKNFKFITSRNLAVQSVGGSISVIAAFSGAGIYALLINPIFTSVLMFIINYRKNPLRIKFSPKLSSIRKIFSFSLYQFLFNLINYFSRNLDKLLIGNYLSVSLLGYYEKSYRLMMLPLQNITHVITPVMHPVFSDFQDRLQELNLHYLKIIRLLALIGFSLSVYLWFDAEEFILLVFGDQWQASVSPFRILSITVGFQIILSTSGSIFQAANDTRTMFISGLISAVTNVCGMLTGIFLFQSLDAVAWGLCISFILNFFQCFILMYRITFQFSMVPFWKQYALPALLSGCLIILFNLLSPLIINFQLLVRLILKTCLLFLTVCLFIQFNGLYDLRKLVSLLKKK